MECIVNSPFFKMRVKFLSVTDLTGTVFSTFDQRVKEWKRGAVFVSLSAGLCF